MTETPQLFFASVDPDETGAHLLSADERRRRDRFTHMPSRRAFVTARQLLRKTLADLGGVDPSKLCFQTTDKGRPFLEPVPPTLGDLDFNLAHSHDLVALATLRGGDVGVDVEPLERPLDYDLVAERFFSDQEIADLKRLSDDERHQRFLALWVLKEAWLKADGRGISAGLHRVVFRFQGGEPRLRALPDDDPGAWEVRLLQAHDHHVGVAFRVRV